MDRLPSAVFAASVVTVAASGQTIDDPRLTVDVVATGFGDDYAFHHTDLTFVDEWTALALERSNGRVSRVDLVDGEVVALGGVVLDLDIVSGDAGSGSEYGVQGIVAHPDVATNGFVYVRYDRSPRAGADTPQSDVVLGPHPSASVPTINAIERYAWDGAALTFDRTIHEITFDTRYHHGGDLVFDATGALLTVVGDLRRTGSGGWQQDHGGPLMSANVASGVPEDMSVVLRLDPDGGPATDNPFDPGDPLVPETASDWFAYGIRNSIGIAVDPLGGAVWLTDNGEVDFDEINRVTPGFNGGWKDIVGPLDHPDQTGSLDQLVTLPGSTYGDPAFAWRHTIGVTAIEFLECSRLGPEWDGGVLAGCYNDGLLWHFTLAPDRASFQFETEALQDGVDDRVNPLSIPPGADAEEIVLGSGFGGFHEGIISLARTPAGRIHALLGDGRLVHIRRTAAPTDINGDGVVGVDDLITLLSSWGPCPPCHCMGDGDLSGVIDVADLIALLGDWE